MKNKFLLSFGLVFLFILSGNLLSSHTGEDYFEHHMMGSFTGSYMDFDHMNWGGNIYLWIIGVLIIVVLILLIIFLIKKIQDKK
ncbi:hypothetical protein K9L16_02525 [Candidatus Pacearchaeota archaeon]|nr:hypothetical protein [Candidatus Pacearchaeota archaeon]